MNFKLIILFSTTFFIVCLSDCVPDLISANENSRIKGNFKQLNTTQVFKFIPLLNQYEYNHTNGTNKKLFTITCIKKYNNILV